jgi:hypothetical protein
MREALEELLFYGKALPDFAIRKQVPREGRKHMKGEL